VAIESVENGALSQVPDFTSSILRGGNEVIASRMEIDRIDCTVMSVIVLEQSLRSSIEYLNLTLGTAGSYTRPSRLILDSIDHASVILNSC